MKNTFKFIMAMTVVFSSMFYSCETIELENLDNPNALSPDQADAEFLLNNVQLNYRNVVTSINNNGSALTRITNFGNRNYFAGLTGGTLDFAWSVVYSDMVPDLAAIQRLNEDPTQDLSFHVGTSQIMLGHSLLLLVDYIGDIPFDQINNPDEFPSPMLQDGASVYDAAKDLISQGIANLSNIGGADDISPEVEDLYYDEDFTKWIKAGNTILLKAAITTGDLETFDDIIDDDNFISSTEDDLQFRYGTNLINPNVRHPDFNTDYTPSGNNIYQSNWLMNQMLETNDPRIRYYFFRQSGCTPGADCDPDGDGETLSCSLQTPPAHYGQETTFCFLPDGYWGRDHGDDGGAPPDNFLKTAVGVYPAGGKLDLNNFDTVVVSLNDNDTEDDDSDDFFELVLDDSDDQVGQELGGQGAGIEPIILASYVDFWRAEAALLDGDTDDAEDFLEAGLEKSIAKVRSFGDLDTANLNKVLDADIDEDTGELSDIELASSLLPDSDDIEDFIEDITDDFDDADMDGKFNILAEQYFVTLYGGAAESYNFYRRQGYPTSLQPNLQADPGPFPRSFPYPTSEIVANPNVNQKPNYDEQVFWDNNPASSATGGFPEAN